MDNRNTETREYSRAPVRRICKELGYGGKEKESRSFLKVKNKTLSFRQEWIEQTLRLSNGETFPTDPSDPIVRTCVRDFLNVKEYREFWADTEEARQSQLLTLRHDERRIKELLAKLMCYQAKSQQKNHNSKNSVQSNPPSPAPLHTDTIGSPVITSGRTPGRTQRQCAQRSHRDVYSISPFLEEQSDAEAESFERPVAEMRIRPYRPASPTPDRRRKRKPTDDDDAEFRPEKIRCVDSSALARNASSTTIDNTSTIPSADPRAQPLTAFTPRNTHPADDWASPETTCNICFRPLDHTADDCPGFNRSTRAPADPTLNTMSNTFVDDNLIGSTNQASESSHGDNTNEQRPARDEETNGAMIGTPRETFTSSTRPQRLFAFVSEVDASGEEIRDMTDQGTLNNDNIGSNSQREAMADQRRREVENADNDSRFDVTPEPEDATAQDEMVEMLAVDAPSTNQQTNNNVDMTAEGVDPSHQVDLEMVQTLNEAASRISPYSSPAGLNTRPNDNNEDTRMVTSPSDSIHGKPIMPKKGRMRLSFVMERSNVVPNLEHPFPLETFESLTCDQMFRMVASQRKVKTSPESILELVFKFSWAEDERVTIPRGYSEERWAEEKLAMKTYCEWCATFYKTRFKELKVSISARVEGEFDIMQEVEGGLFEFVSARIPASER